MSDTLLIVGASARAAASSAVRAGFQPACADLFADADLRRLGPARATADFPNGFIELSRQLPAGPWIYTGGIENHPELVEAISQARLLYGNSPATLRGVRDPAKLAAAFYRHGLPFLECRWSAEGLPVDGAWLRKRFHSSGGHGVQVWQGAGNREPNDAYFQRRIAGASCAAIYVAAGGQAKLIGVTRQWIGAGREDDFHYCGSFGPLRLTPERADSWLRIGAALAAEFDLEGLFGVDAVVDREGRIWPVEVNPRYTASVEILERGFGLAAVGWHVAACRDGCLPEAALVARGWHGKAILYAPCDLVVREEMLAAFDRMNEGQPWPRLADLPCPGTTVRRGQPLVTVFAMADQRQGIEQQLHAYGEQAIEIARNMPPEGRGE